MHQINKTVEAANLARLESINLPEKWVEKHLEGWKEDDWDQLLDEIKSAGCWPVDPDKLGSLIEGLFATKPPAPRRTRKGGIQSIEEIQTPTTQADAAWAEPHDFAERFLFKEGDFWIGRCPETDVALGYHDDRHVFMTCGSRSGKGTGFIIPNHLLWPGPLVSLDPKGENATVSAARRGEGNDVCVGMGQKVCVLDPLGVSHVDDKYRCRFNPFDELDPNDSTCNRKAAAIADSLVLRTGRENEDYWKDETRSMLHGLILHIVSASQFEGRRHLGTLRKLIIHGDVEAAEAAGPPPDAPQKQRDPFGMLFCLMMENPAFDGEVAGAGRSLFEMMKKGDRQWIGVHSGMRIHTDWLRDREMRSCVEASDFTLSEIKSRPEGMSVYLCLPERDMSTYSRWQRVLLNLMAYEFQGSRALPVCEHRILMCLDEFAALDKLKEFERGIAYFAGYGVKLLVVLQGLSKLKSIYEDNWEEFLGNSSVKIFFDLGDITTPATLSELLGDIELVRYAENRNVNASGQQTRSATANRSKQDTDGIQVGGAISEGTSDVHTQNEGSNTNEGVGGGHTKQRGDGTSETSSYERYRWIGRNLQKTFGRLREKEGMALSRNKQQSVADSDQWNRGFGKFVGTAYAKGRTQQDTINFGKNKNVSLGEAAGLAAMVGEALAYGGGYQETFQKRALALPKEIREWFTRINDEEHPYYPGLAIVLVSAEPPAIIRRVNYFTDEKFDALWDRDPAYPQTEPLPLLRTLGIQLHGEKGELWLEHEGVEHGPEISEWHKRPGEWVRKGDLLLEVKPGPAFTPFCDSLIPVYAPATGHLDHAHVREGEAFKFGALLGMIRYHIGRARDENHIQVLNEVAAFNCGEHVAYQAFERKLQDHRRQEQERLEEEEQERLVQLEEGERRRLAEIEREKVAAEERAALLEARRKEEAEAAIRNEEARKVYVARHQRVAACVGVGALICGVLYTLAWAKSRLPNLEGFLGYVGFGIGFLVLIAISAGIGYLVYWIAKWVIKPIWEHAWTNRQHGDDEAFHEARHERRQRFFKNDQSMCEKISEAVYGPLQYLGIGCVIFAGCNAGTLFGPSDATSEPADPMNPLPPSWVYDEIPKDAIKSEDEKTGAITFKKDHGVSLYSVHGYPAKVNYFTDTEFHPKRIAIRPPAGNGDWLGDPIPEELMIYKQMDNGAIICKFDSSIPLRSYRGYSVDLNSDGEIVITPPETPLVEPYSWAWYQWLFWIACSVLASAILAMLIAQGSKFARRAIWLRREGEWVKWSGVPSEPEIEAA